jgi:hypothetical protein
MGLGLSAPAFAANNNTAANALHLPTDGTAMHDYIYGSAGPGTTQRWYVTTLKGGRSYATQTVTDFSGPTLRNCLAFIDLFQQDATTPLAGVLNKFSLAESMATSNAGTPLVSGFAGGTRMVYVDTDADNTDRKVFIRITELGQCTTAGDFLFFRVSIQDTTVYGPWFYTDGNYESYVTFQNRSSASVNATVTWYQLNTSTALGSSLKTLPPFSSTFVAAKATTGLAAGALGSVKITHDGPPGAINANLTAVNTTGIGTHHSFNMPFFQQVPAQAMGAPGTQ